MKQALLVFLGGGLGSALRYFVGKYFNYYNFPIPLGTFSVNIIGSLLLGIILGLSLKNDILTSTTTLLLATGFCGGFTTFSTFAFENQVMLRSGDFLNFALYTFGSIFFGILAVILGVFVSKFM